ncbi:MAG: 6-phosphogluconolactonase [Nanoarchaeota archaeon]|nr:6-phosphogluconolactonase [Nanoarchaeota archaeon]MBU0976791.1 6-phosphogluconolactonase [Nanoarchaeota archaeon]
MDIIKGNREELDVKAAEAIGDALSRFSEEKTNVVFGVSGGRDVLGVFEALKQREIDWTFVEIFMLDECFVGFKDPDSTFGQAKRGFIGDLIEKGSLSSRNVHYFDPKKKIDSYQDEFIAAGGTFDVVLAALEMDGRIASLFPHGAGLKEEDSFVVMKDAPLKLKKRMTVTRKVLEHVGEAVLVVYGMDKKESFEMFLDESVDVNECPAKVLEGAENLQVFSDLKG